MNRKWSLGCLVLSCGFLGGCALQEVRSKSRGGSEWQHKGSDSTNAMRYSVEQGLEFKWDQGIGTGISVRRRDQDDGTGDNDTGLWLDVSFPIWKAPKKAEASAAHVQALEARLAQLEAAYSKSGLAPMSVTDSGESDVDSRTVGITVAESGPMESGSLVGSH